MNEEKLITRKFFIGDVNNTPPLSEEQLLSKIKTDENYMVIADGGMGKSFLSKRWIKKLSFKGFTRINAQELESKDIKDKLIIDNLDEIPLEKANNIIEQICLNKIKGILIFSRPESVWAKDNTFFKKINFFNMDNKNPRYSMEYEIDGEDLYEGFQKYFMDQLQSDQLFDFLSILSFKLLTSGVIHYNSQSLFEFIRKYNINNNSTVSISILTESGLFKQVASDIYFKNKTIPAFFAVMFLRKFAHIDNSYLSYFDNFSSQIAFSETAKIIRSSESNELAWNLVSKNGFVFMFLERYESATGLVDILHYGIDLNPSIDLTDLLSRLISKIANDEDFNGVLYLDEFNAKIFSSVNIKSILTSIMIGIKNINKKRIAIHHFCNWAKYSIIFLKDKEKWIEIKKQLKDIFPKKILDIRRGDEGNKRNFADVLFGIDSIKNFNKETYDNYCGPIESAIKFYLVLNRFEELIVLLDKFGWSKPFFELNIEAEWKSFLSFLIESNKSKLVIDLIRTTRFPTKINVDCLKTIGDEKIIKIIANERCYYCNKIKVTQKYYNDLTSRDTNAYIFASNFYPEIDEERKEIINFKDMEKDISQFSFNRYINQYSGYYPTLKLIEIAGWDEKYMDNLLAKIKKSFDDPKFGPDVLENIEPIYQIVALKRKIKIEEIHPMILVQLNNIRMNSRRIEYWFDSFDAFEVKRRVIKYFRKTSNMERIFNSYNTHILGTYLEDILEEINTEEKIYVLSKLKKSLNPLHWWDLFYKYRTLDIAKDYMKDHNELPTNLYEYINNFKKSNYQVHEGLLSITTIKKMFIDLLKSKFSNIYRKGGGTVHWYDNFFFAFGEKEYISKMLIILEKNKLGKWYSEKFIKLFPQHIEASPDYVIYTFVKHLATLSYLTGDINEREVLIDFKKILSPDLIPVVDRSWLSLKGMLFEGVNKGRVFNISEYFRYMNDDWTRAEFNSVFKEEIVPLISEIFKRHKSSKKVLETLIHDDINVEIPVTLMQKYSIIYQAESNPFNNLEARKRIDFILSRNNKYIFVELKTSNNSQLTGEKIGKQLGTYKSNIVIADNYLIIFKVHNMTKERRRKIDIAALTKGFKIIDIT